MTRGADREMQKSAILPLPNNNDLEIESGPNQLNDDDQEGVSEESDGDIDIESQSLRNRRAVELQRLKAMSTRNMLRRDDEDSNDSTSSLPPSLGVDGAFDIAPYLSNEDIRGILACHIVGSLVHLIEKEEKLLKQKINDLIKKQFDFLLSDMSRIFSEIPHFHGLNADAFRRPTSKSKHKL